jgi:hypothetical protein
MTEIVCGNRAHDPLRSYLAGPDGKPRRIQVHHPSVAMVSACFKTDGGLPTVEDDHLRAECEAEARAEEGYERWLEDGGPHAASIAAEYEQERREEERRGVIPFAEAMAEAEFRQADDRMWA